MKSIRPLSILCTNLSNERNNSRCYKHKKLCSSTTPADYRSLKSYFLSGNMAPKAGLKLRLRFPWSNQNPNRSGLEDTLSACRPVQKGLI
uniref:Uncharacterized protein n=1 Tax=Arundo donax TaxID=35708 RepID=A0A0A8Z3J0_ARUDO